MVDGHKTDENGYDCVNGYDYVRTFLVAMTKKAKGIGSYSKLMIKYYVTKKACISTLTGIIYSGMNNYGDANS